MRAAPGRVIVAVPVADDRRGPCSARGFALCRLVRLPSFGDLLEHRVSALPFAVRSHLRLARRRSRIRWPRRRFRYRPYRAGRPQRSGKSTLLRLIGRAHPRRGSITVDGSIGYLRQDIALDPARRVDAILGIAVRGPPFAASSPALPPTSDFAAVSGTLTLSQWDVEERAVAVLGRLGLGHIVGSTADLSRPVGTLSGGETVLLALTAELLREPAVVLLDEPTNNLDLRARELLYQAVEQFPGTLVVVSHDRALLDRMDDRGIAGAGAVSANCACSAATSARIRP